jgi:hypothetical protein
VICARTDPRRTPDAWFTADSALFCSLALRSALPLRCHSECRSSGSSAASSWRHMQPVEISSPNTRTSPGRTWFTRRGLRAGCRSSMCASPPLSHSHRLHVP